MLRMRLRIYLSSTFEDLESQRDLVLRALRMMRHDVVAMEDYVAADRTALEQSLEDVASSDIYVGLVAWRYGFVPKRGNPHKLSITELEMREAERVGIPRLFFVLKEDAPWASRLRDQCTGENDSGERIMALRASILEEQERLAGMFTTSEELVAKVGAAIYRHHLGLIICSLPEAARGRLAPASNVDRHVVGSRHDCPRLWMPGSTLHMQFLGGERALQDRILRLARLWSAYANIEFVRSETPDAELRIGFNPDSGSWAYCGADALEVDPPEPTINFDSVSSDSTSVELESAVSSTFGTVLGLVHEHQNPFSEIPWNKDHVYAHMGSAPYFWTKEMVDAHVFRRYAQNVYPIPKPFDPDSIMMRPIPAEWTADGVALGTTAGTISPGDKEFVTRLYPYPG